jgi:hypothetical protein
MPRTPARVTQSDVARVLRAVAQTGLAMRVRILPDGQIVVEPVDATAPAEQYKGQIRL